MITAPLGVIGMNADAGRFISRDELFLFCRKTSINNFAKGSSVLAEKDDLKCKNRRIGQVF